jgi:hypothetical protein
MLHSATAGWGAELIAPSPFFLSQVESSLRSELEGFPNLAATVNEYATGFMTEALGPADQMIRSLVDCHLSYINMSHPQFVGACPPRIVWRGFACSTI